VMVGVVVAVGIMSKLFDLLSVLPSYHTFARQRRKYKVREICESSTLC
jgi:hypothetical protein